MLEVARGIKKKWETHTGSIHPLVLWTPGAGRHLEKGGVGPCRTLTRIVSGLVRKSGCVKSRVLVKNGGQLICNELLNGGWLAPRLI